MYMDFEYAGHRLSDFGYAICSFGNSLSDYEINIGCDITFTEIKNNHSSIHRKVSSSYDSVYTATFDIIKYNCNSRDDINMTSLEVRDLVKWLNRRDNYKLKFISEFADDSNVHYYGRFNVQQKMIGGRVVGLTLTFTSNAPYGFSDVIESKFMMLNPGEKHIFFGDSDEYGLIYPRIEIRCFSSGMYIITNETTGTKVEISNCVVGEIIIIDGEHKIIYSDKEEHNKTIPNDFEYEYLDILVDEFNSQNVYVSNLPCELTISYMPIRKVGVI